MINAHSLCLAFGSQTIFDNLSFIFAHDQRIGLVGRNGSGKSTLLEALVHPALLDSGSVSIVRGKKIAYMPQDVVLQSDKSILEEAFTAFEHLHALQKKIEQIEHSLATTADTTDLLTAYAAAQEELRMFNPEMALAKTKKMLAGLGFTQDQLQQSVATLSVGWKMRIVLAKLLLQEADFYLFDEPTNHLDLLAKEWFLSFLQASDFGFMIVCHERYFLDELCDTILELENGKGTLYKGNYSVYETQKEQALQRLESAYLNQQKDIKRKQETIERFRAKASKATQAQSMLKALDKIERITLPPSPKNVGFSFPPIAQAGRSVLQVHNAAQSFGSKHIFTNVSFEIERGQKAAVIAPNGAGKTTLFNLISGSLPMRQGKVIFGYNVTSTVFDQDQTRSLNTEKSVIDNVRQRCPKKTEQALRTMLGSFLFSGDMVQKKVGVLSGGEKNRVGMVCVLLQDANLLLLDEPTNHLDIPSKEILLKALQEYAGTIIFVSHDRDFVNALATHIIELTATGAHVYHGNYDSYVEQRKAQEPIAPHVSQDDSAEKGPASDKKELFELHKKSKRLEEKITRLESDIQATEYYFAEVEYGTPEYTHNEQKLKKLRDELTTTEREWEDLQKKRLS